MLADSAVRLCLTFVYQILQKSPKAYDGESKTFTPEDHIQLKKNSCGCVYEMGFNGPDVRTIPFLLDAVVPLSEEVSNLAVCLSRTTRSDG